MTSPSIMLAAVEPSGDALGAALFGAMKKISPNIDYFGCGGAAMEARGFSSLFPTAPFAVMGFTDVAKVLPLGLRRAAELAAEAARRRAKAAILVDGWAFSRILAKRLRAVSPSTKIIKYVAPQIWASRPQRIDFVKKYFDGVLTVLPFEPAIFQRAGVPAAFVGNPTFQAARAAVADGDAFRAQHRLQHEKIVIVLPGSRRGEIARLAPIFEEAATLLSARINAVKFVVPLAPATPAEWREHIKNWRVAPLVIEPDEKYSAFAAANAALAASGTVTTELAIHGAPTIIAYRVDPLTAFWARRVVTTNFASILNFQAGRAVMPEYLQNDCAPRALANALHALVTRDGEARAQIDALKPLLAGLDLDGPPAADRAATQIFEWISDVDDPGTGAQSGK